MQTFGWIGIVCLVAAGIPQAGKVFRAGHAHGMSWWYIAFLLVGFSNMLVFTIASKAGLPLILSYVFQIGLFLAIACRKRWPRKDATE